MKPLHRSSAFTLPELLTTIAIIAALLLILLPALQQMRKRSDQVRCQNHLRSIGTILINAANEQGPTMSFWYVGSAGVMWNTMLVVNGYVTHAQLKAMSCPNIAYAAANGSTSGRHYGIFTSAPEGRIHSYTDKNGYVGNVYTLPIRTHPSPASALFLTDCVTSGGAPSIRCSSGAPDRFDIASGGIHLRHLNKANLFFLDGHIEPSSPERLAELGVKAVFDSQLVRKTVPSHP